MERHLTCGLTLRPVVHLTRDGEYWKVWDEGDNPNPFVASLPLATLEYERRVNHWIAHKGAEENYWRNKK